MNKSLFAAVALVLAGAGQAFAADTVSVCPTRDKGEALGVFRGRAHDYCEVKWSGLVARAEEIVRPIPGRGRVV